MDIPNHRIADSEVVHDHTTLTVMTHANLVAIHLDRADLHNTPLESQYSQHLEQFTTNEDIIDPDDDLPDDDEQFEDSRDWIIQPCAAQRRLAPEIRPRGGGDHFAAFLLCTVALFEIGNRMGMAGLLQYMWEATRSRVAYPQSQPRNYAYHRLSSEYPQHRR